MGDGNYESWLSMKRFEASHSSLDCLAGGVGEIYFGRAHGRKRYRGRENLVMIMHSGWRWGWIHAFPSGTGFACSVGEHMLGLLFIDV